MLGTHHTVIDNKNRINVPAKIRDDLGAKFYITVSLSDPCLVIYLPDEYEELRRKIHALPGTASAKIRRVIFGNACEREPDKQGRILIPPELRDHAKLADDVVIVGTDNTAEIWSKAEYDKFANATTADELRSLSEELGI